MKNEERAEIMGFWGGWWRKCGQQSLFLITSVTYFLASTVCVFNQQMTEISLLEGGSY